MAVRSESQSCVGEGVYRENLNKFRWILLKASFAPEIYQKELAKPEAAEAQKDAQMEYFRYWANESLFNFLKYKNLAKLIKMLKLRWLNFMRL
ncbi:hypothetical protein QM027_08085 [Campylobacter concisus]